MICLFCGANQDSKVEECGECGIPYERRPPIIGVNHFTQLLNILDDLQAGDGTVEDCEEPFRRFFDLFAEFEQKWKLQEQSLSEQLSPELRDRFGPGLAATDQALQQAYQAIECLEITLFEGEDYLEVGVENLVSSFKGACSAAAQLLEQLDALKQEQGTGSGTVFNLPSV